MKIRKSAVPYIILLIAMIAIHIPLTLDIYDDAYFSSILRDQSITGWLAARYFTWSSRLIIEFFLGLILKSGKWIWVFFDCCVILIGAHSLSNLISDGSDFKINWLTVSLFLIFPFRIFRSAGWAATTINYLWPLCLGLCAVIPIKKVFTNEAIRLWEYPIYTLFLIFAANQEQSCALLLGFYCLAFIFTLLYKCPKKYIAFQLGVCVASMLFILTCPGNKVRLDSEISSWFLDYNMLTVTDKLQIGITHALGTYLFTPSTIFFLFSLLLLLGAYLQKPSPKYKAISLVPFVCTLTFGTAYPLVNGYYPGIENIKNSITDYGFITLENYNLISSYIPLLITGAVTICTVLSFFIIYGPTLKGLIQMVILAAGFLSSFILAFSPTVHISGERTNTFFYFCIAICILQLYAHIKDLLTKFDTVFFAGTSFISLLSIANFLYSI